MSNQINDGGPAFSLQVFASPNSEIQFGLSLRDWFAGMALQGLCANPEAAKDIQRGKPQAMRPVIAAGCYGVADAMLAERMKGTNEP